MVENCHLVSTKHVKKISVNLEKLSFSGKSTRKSFWKCTISEPENLTGDPTLQSLRCHFLKVSKNQTESHSDDNDLGFIIKFQEIERPLTGKSKIATSNLKPVIKTFYNFDQFLYLFQTFQLDNKSAKSTWNCFNLVSSGFRDI